jgi:hypothetical protein
MTTIPAGNNFTAISANGNYTVALHAVDCSSILPGDVNYDCFVDFKDIGVLAQNWLALGCISPSWCNGTDTNRSRNVDFRDFAAFAQNIYHSSHK